MHSVTPLAEALKKVPKSPKITGGDIILQKALNGLNDASQRARQKAKEAEEIQNMRRHWSCFLMVCIGIILFFDILLILLLGFHKISFENDYAVPIFIIDGLLKIIGLAVIVVKFLFNEKNTLNNKKDSSSQ